MEKGPMEERPGEDLCREYYREWLGRRKHGKPLAEESTEQHQQKKARGKPFQISARKKDPAKTHANLPAKYLMEQALLIKYT